MVENKEVYRSNYIDIQEIYCGKVIVSIWVYTLEEAPASAQWIEENGRWWYKHADGSCTKHAWEEIGGKWYYFNLNGAMAVDQWIDNSYVGVSGAWEVR